MIVRRGKYLGKNIFEVMYKHSDQILKWSLNADMIRRHQSLFDMIDIVSGRLEDRPLKGKCDLCSASTDDLNLIRPGTELESRCGECFHGSDKATPMMESFYEVLCFSKGKRRFRKALKKYCVFKGMKDDFTYKSYLDFMINKVMAPR